MLRYKLFEANREKGFNFPFILVCPSRFNKKVKIYVEGNNSVNYGKEGQQDFETQKNIALQYAGNLTKPQDGSVFNMPYLYQCLNQPVIIPIIERCDNKHIGEFYTQMLGANVVKTKTGDFANLSTQVVNMVNYVKEGLKEKGVLAEQKSGLIGMSTSGVFAGRMLFAEPESFDTCLSVCSNAVQPLPLKELNGTALPYPLGTADYKQLFGKEFNETEYQKAKQLFIVGKEEPNDKYNIAKNFRLHDKNVQDLYVKVYGDVDIQQRQQEMANIFKENGFDNVECVVADGGHTMSGKGNVIMNWAKEIINEDSVVREKDDSVVREKDDSVVREFMTK